MKKLLLLLLSLSLLLCACGKKPHTFTRSEDGTGFVDEKTNVFYRLLNEPYEPLASGETIGECVFENSGTVREFRAIPELDSLLFLTDNHHNVYLAGERMTPAAERTPTLLLVCEEDAISVERKRFTPGTNDDAIGRILDLWFGESNGTLPLKTPQVSYRLKLAGDLYPNLLYCFSFLYYGEGEAYFYDPLGRHTVALPEDVIALLYAPTGAQGG
jgi:hypothetical protein